MQAREVVEHKLQLVIPVAQFTQFKLSAAKTYPLWHCVQAVPVGLHAAQLGIGVKYALQTVEDVK